MRKDAILVFVVFCFLLALPSRAFLAPLSSDASARMRIFAWVDSAHLALDQRDVNRATQLYEKARSLAQSQNDYLATAALQNFIGDLFERTGQSQDALQQYEFGIIALNTRQAGELAGPVGNIINRLRGMEKGYSGSRGDPVSTDLYRGEIADLKKLLRQNKVQAHQELAVMLMLNAGNMYLQQFQFSLADSLYLQALQVARSSRLRRQQQEILANLAWSSLKDRQFARASSWLDSVMVATSNASPSVELRRALLAVGVNWREQGNYDKAVSDLQHALSLYKTAGDSRGECRALAHLATTYLSAGDYAKAKQNYLEALRLNENVQDDETGWHASGGLARCYHRLGDLEKATQYYEQYLQKIEKIGSSWETDQGRIGFLENHEQIFQDYVQVALRVAEQKKNFTYARNAIERGRSRALNALQLARLHQSREKTGHLDAGYFYFREQWPDLRLKLSGGVMSNRDMMVQMAPNVFAGGVPAPMADAEELLAQAVDTVAAPRTTFLEYFVLDDRLVVFVKSIDGAVRGAIVPITADSLTTLVTAYGQAIAVETPRGMQFTRNITPVALKRNPAAKRDEAEVSRQLYQLLIEPIQSFLPGDPQQPIVIVPHQSLWQLPFAALRNAQNRFFGDEHVLTYAASESNWRLIARQRRKADHQNINGWVVGNPTMPASLTLCGGTFTMQPLPGAQDEAKTIARLLNKKNKAELFLGGQANRLRLEAWHPDFSVIHFATHGFACSSDPLSSFIVLAESKANQLRLDRNTAQLATVNDTRYSVTLDSLPQVLDNPDGANMAELFYPGILDARTIISRFHLNADLVTLSACQTGLGQLSNEGIIGLSRAFLAAGARSFLVSLWNVDDQATKELMITFYNEYIRHGNKGLALQRAMQQTRQRYPAPKYWAAFTLVGMAE